MPSPAKKRKLNHGAKSGQSQSKGLEYFFSKQKKTETDAALPVGLGEPSGIFTSAELTDEELARKLQAEFDQETAYEAGSGETEDAKGPALDAETTLSLQPTGTAEDIITSSIPLDESPLTFDLTKHLSQILPGWARLDGNASYGLLTRCFSLVSSTTSRIKIVDTLVNCLRLLIEGNPSSLLPAVSPLGALLSKALTRLGLARDELDISTIHILGARPRRLSDLESP